MCPDSNPMRLWNDLGGELESGREKPKFLEFGNFLKWLSCLLFTSFHNSITPDQVNGMTTYHASGKEKYLPKFRQPIINTNWRIKYICVAKRGYWKIRVENKKSVFELRSISKSLATKSIVCRVRPVYSKQFLEDSLNVRRKKTKLSRTFFILKNY